MAKKRKQYEPKYRDALDNSVYVFHNQIFNIDLFALFCKDLLDVEKKLFWGEFQLNNSRFLF